MMNAIRTAISFCSFIVFFILDIVDFFLCHVFYFVDVVTGHHWGPCYCNDGKNSWLLKWREGTNSNTSVGVYSEIEDQNLLREVSRSWSTPSSSLVNRYKLGEPRTLVNIFDSLRNFLRRNYRIKGNGLKSVLHSVQTDPGPFISEPSTPNRSFGKSKSFSGFSKLDKRENQLAECGIRWSDCNCKECCEWVNMYHNKLFFHVEGVENCKRDELEYLEGKFTSLNELEGELVGKRSNSAVIFIHGFVSSSSFFTDTIFPQFSQKFKDDFLLIAVDLLGFGRSPKPKYCQYTISDHIDWIEKSILSPLNITKFHIVAHSMGCLVGLSLAAKHSKNVSSVNLLAPPYDVPVPGVPIIESYFKKAAPRSIWPPLAFGIGIMGWYEHLGRVVCFILNKSHTLWEPIFVWLSGNRIPKFLMRDFAKHTHHSGWHAFHNTICGGIQLVDPSLSVLKESGVQVSVVHGDKDKVCPFSLSEKLVEKNPWVNFHRLKNKNHVSMAVGNEKNLALLLEKLIAGACDTS